ncbi:MAG: hypothetical protein ACRD12_01645 [Acidimicrobiales bacterium]
MTEGMPDLLMDLPDNGDQVARQRRKRATVLLDRPVAGFDDLTLNDVLRAVVAAIHESDGPLDVEAFLIERGHVWQTVEMVQACLVFVDRHVSSPPPQTGP